MLDVKNIKLDFKGVFGALGIALMLNSTSTYALTQINVKQNSGNSNAKYYIELDNGETIYSNTSYVLNDNFSTSYPVLDIDPNILFEESDTYTEYPVSNDYGIIYLSYFSRAKDFELVQAATWKYLGFNVKAKNATDLVKLDTLVTTAKEYNTKLSDENHRYIYSDLKNHSDKLVFELDEQKNEYISNSFYIDSVDYAEFYSGIPDVRIPRGAYVVNVSTSREYADSFKKDGEYQVHIPVSDVDENTVIYIGAYYTDVKDINVFGVLREDKKRLIQAHSAIGITPSVNTSLLISGKVLSDEFKNDEGDNGNENGNGNDPTLGGENPNDPSNPNEPSKEELLQGDINKDEKVNSTDAALVLELFSNGTWSEEELKLGDVNGDGKLNSTDAAIILELYQKLK